MRPFDIKILLSPQIFQDQPFGGISRYHMEVYTELKKRDNVEIDCPILYTDNLHFKSSTLFKTSFQSRYAQLISLGKILRPFLPKKLKRKNTSYFLNIFQKLEFDLFVPTYYDPAFLAYVENKPFVLTIHDMIHELFPQYFVGDIHTVPNKKLLIEKATRIIAVSENTKKDLLKIYPHIDPSKIDVVHLAYTLNKDSITEPELPKKYILFVGNRTLYKNFLFFLKAIAPILKKSPDLRLLCAGGGHFHETEVQLIYELDLADQVLQQNFDDSELFSYYKNALCFVFPSEYEGFGIPILEAMASGCPVLLTNHSSFPEIAGDAGIYFELNNEADLRKQISRLLQNEDLRKEVSKKGLVQIQKFSWKKTADECFKVYQKAI